MAPLPSTTTNSGPPPPPPPPEQAQSGKDEIPTSGSGPDTDSVKPDRETTTTQNISELDPAAAPAAVSLSTGNSNKTGGESSNSLAPPNLTEAAGPVSVADSAARLSLQDTTGGVTSPSSTPGQDQPNLTQPPPPASTTATTPSVNSMLGMASPNESVLEVDSEDLDSAVGDLDDSTLSQSVRSSVYDFVEENGRTYHKYKEGQYFLPNDETERDRLDLQHQLFLLTFHNQLYLAPTGELHNVLDIGTGTGIWAIDFAARHPSAHVIGTDLSPIQPNYIPPNCSFEIDDAEDPWAFPHKFDLIHGRALASCFKDPQKVINSAFKNLAPNGWLEFQDLIIPMRCIDDSWEGSALKKWNMTVVECVKRIGRDTSYSQRYSALFTAAGLVDVQARYFVWPSNQWVKGKHNKKIATWFLKDLSDGLEAISLRILSGVAGMGKEEIDALLDAVRNDLANPKIHAYMSVTVTMGRKPAEE